MSENDDELVEVSEYADALDEVKHEEEEVEAQESVGGSYLILQYKRDGAHQKRNRILAKFHYSDEAIVKDSCRANTTENAKKNKKVRNTENSQTSLY